MAAILTLYQTQATTAFLETIIIDGVVYQIRTTQLESTVFGLYDIAGNCVKLFPGHLAKITCIASCKTFTGQTIIISAGQDKELRRWDPTTGKQIGEPLQKHTAKITCLTVCVLPNGLPIIISGDEMGKLIRWDASSGKCLGYMSIEPPSDASFAKVRLKEHACEITYLTTCTSDSLPLIISVDSQGNISHWNANTGHLMECWDIERNIVCGTSYSRGGRLFLVLAEFAGELFGDVNQYEFKRYNTSVLHLQQFRNITCLITIKYPNDIILLFGGSTDGNIYALDANTRTHLTVLTGHTASITCLTPSMLPTGLPIIISSSQDGTIRHWNGAQPITISHYPAQATKGTLHWAAYRDRTQKPIMVCGDENGTLYQYDAITGELLYVRHEQRRASIVACATMVRDDGQTMLITMSDDNHLSYYYLDTGEHVIDITLPHEYRYFTTYALNELTPVFLLERDNQLIAYGLNNVDNQHPVLLNFLGHSGGITAFTNYTASDGTIIIVVGCTDSTLHRWNGRTAERIGNPIGQPSHVFGFAITYCLAYKKTNDHFMIAVGKENGNLVLFCPISLESTKLEGHTGKITCGAHARTVNGKEVFFSGSEDRTIRCWNAQTGKPIGSPVSLPTAPSIIMAVTATFITVGLSKGDFLTINFELQPLSTLAAIAAPVTRNIDQETARQCIPLVRQGKTQYVV